MNKKIITSLLFCMSLAAHADSFTFTVKDKENKLVNEVKLYTDMESSTAYSSKKSTQYIKVCEHLQILGDDKPKFSADLVELVPGQVTVGTFLNIIHKNNGIIQFTYDISELISIKTITASNCTIQAPDVENITATLDIGIKSGETVSVGDFRGNVLSLTRN